VTQVLKSFRQLFTGIRGAKKNGVAATFDNHHPGVIVAGHFRHGTVSHHS